MLARAIQSPHTCTNSYSVLTGLQEIKPFCQPAFEMKRQRDIANYFAVPVKKLC